MKSWFQYRRLITERILRCKEGERIPRLAIPFYFILWPSRIIDILRPRIGSIQYDWNTETYTIYGMKYSDELFREMSEDGIPIGDKFEIVSRKDGLVTINRLPNS